MSPTRRSPSEPTALHRLRFSSVMSTAVATTAAMAHLLELPAKRRYEPSLYVRLHRTLYWNFGRLVGPVESVAVLTTGALTWMLRRRSPADAPTTAAAAACLLAAHATFWAVVYPVNVEMVKWPLDAIPDDWRAWRDRWEYGHAVRAGLITGALATLVWTHVDASADASRKA